GDGGDRGLHPAVGRDRGAVPEGGRGRPRLLRIGAGDGRRRPSQPRAAPAAPLHAWSRRVSCAGEIVLDNATWTGASPRLSVLTPFKGDDPTPLIEALGRERVEAEVVLLDDGTGDPELVARVKAGVEALQLPARLVVLARNEGRAKGRNRLVRHARAGHLLFLDSDMLPDEPDFLAAWLELIAAGDPAVAFGGLSLRQAGEAPEHALHRAMAL